jgi:chemosensory pili system protein ChpA (sensor histidine kinase/response regulator)
MTSFSLDEGALMFQSDVASLLSQFDASAASLDALLAAQPADDHVAHLEYVGHSLLGVSRTVGAEGTARCGAAIEVLAGEARRALERVRAIASVLRGARPIMVEIAEADLAREVDEAEARVKEWVGGMPTLVRGLLSTSDGAPNGVAPGRSSAVEAPVPEVDRGHDPLQQVTRQIRVEDQLAIELQLEDAASPASAVPTSQGATPPGEEKSSFSAVIAVESGTVAKLGPRTTTSTERLESGIPSSGFDLLGPAPDLTEDVLDDELREAFRSEAIELIEPVRAGFALLSNDVRGGAADLDRLFHTLKGAAASVGLTRVAEICKELEDTFEAVAEASRAWDPELATHLRSLARAAFGHAGVEFGLATERSVVVAVEKFDIEAEGADEGDEMVATFRVEVRDLSASIRDNLTRYQRGTNEGALNRLERAYHTIRGAAATVGLPDVAAIAQELQDMAERALDADEAPGPDFAARLVEKTNQMFQKVRLPQVEVGAAPTDDIEADFRAEAGEVMHSVADAVGMAFGPHAPQTREESRNRIAGLLHRLGGAAAMNRRNDVGNEALQLERDLLSGAITATTFTAGLGRIAGFLEIELPRIPALENAVREETGGAVQVVPEVGTGPVRETVELMAEREVFDAFVEECAVLLESIDTAILALQESPEPRKVLADLSRLIHTLKGSVNTVGLRPTGKLLHRLEDALEALGGRSVIPSGRAIASMLLAAQEEVRRHLRTAPRGYVESNYAAFDRDVESLLGTGRRTFQRLNDTGPVAIDEERGETENRMIRISSERVDQLMTIAGEMVLSRSRLLARVQRLRTMQRDLVGSRGRLLSVVDGFVDRYEFNIMGSSPKQLLVEDTGRVPVLTVVDGAARGSSGTATEEAARGSFSDLELDRYEDVNILARSLAEVSSDINEVHQVLFSELGNFVEDSESFSSLVSTLQREVMATRMLPMESLYTRVRLLVIDAAERERKDVRTELSGRQVPLDKTILDALYTPLLHVVRNAVTHGIESPEERVRAGKPAVGRVSISARQEAGRVVIDVADDGAGLNLPALRERGIALGLIPAETPVDSPLIPNLVFAPGLSTRATASAQAGRGIGGDAVKASIEALNGSVTVSTVPGRGTTFHIVLPLTLAIMRALIVRNGHQSYAIPLYLTEHILQSGEARVIESSGVRRLMFENQAILAVPMGEMLGVPGEVANGPYVITRIGDARLAVQVDAVVRQEEIFVRGLGSVLTGHPLFAGVTVSGAGEVELIVDVNGLMTAAGVTSRLEVSTPRGAVEKSPVRSKSAGPRKRRALVVDDSLSVRKVAEKFLRALGVDVVLAVDGQDALERLRVETVDIVFTDLEMPRMHGYELIREIRFIPAFADLPIAVVTSRSSQKHRDHARALGANDYVTKPFTQERFAEILNQWLGDAGGQRAEAP